MLQRFNFSFLWFSSKRSLARFLGEKNPFELTRMDNFWAHSPRILILGSGASPAYLILVYYIAEKRQRRLFRNEEMSEEEEKKTYWTQINFYSSPHFKLNYAPLAENISSILQKWRLGSFILSQSQTHSSMVILTASANKQKRQKCQIKNTSPPSSDSKKFVGYLNLKLNDGPRSRGKKHECRSLEKNVLGKIIWILSDTTMPTELGRRST